MRISDSIRRRRPPVVGASDLASAPRTAWWTPLAFVAFVLVALTATPVLVSYHVRKLRDQLTDGSDAGRVIVNDLEAAFTRQLLVQERGRRDTSDNTVRTRRATVNSAALARELRDEVALDTVVRRIDPDAVERFVELRTMAREWHASLISSTGATTAGSASRLLGNSRSALRLQGDLNSEAEHVWSSAQSLDNYLRLRSLGQRAHIAWLARINVMSAVILAPLALAAALALFWTGRRILFFANVAERDRVALSKAMTSKAALVRGLTHDLKNPLGAAYGYAELLEDQVVGPVALEQREMLGRIKGLLTLSVTTVDDLLELYRDGSNGTQLNPVPIDVAEIASDVVADFRPRAQQASLTLTMVRSEHLDSAAATHGQTMVRTDPARVRRILDNLVTNAIKYTPTGGHIWVSIRPSGKPE
ncbi:MAG: sensor histidine kinase, partial [Gemmatimonadales bacterium]